MDQIEFEAYMKAVAKSLDEAFQLTFGRPIGLCLILFEFSEPGVSNYISNADRQGMIMALKKTVQRLEGKEDIPAVYPVKQ